MRKSRARLYSIPSTILGAIDSENLCSSSVFHTRDLLASLFFGSDDVAGTTSFRWKGEVARIKGKQYRG